MEIQFNKNYAAGYQVKLGKKYRILNTVEGASNALLGRFIDDEGKAEIIYIRNYSGKLHPNILSITEKDSIDAN